MTTTAPARAYVNHGRWVADCPRPYCGGAEQLHDTERREACWVELHDQDQPGHERSVYFHCRNCDLITSVDWPADAARIRAALMERPVPQTRNWFPADHPLAVNSRSPHGQSVDDLAAEQRKYEAAG
jgi:hypothetical protein